jgi:ABC-type phosphate/phosphonate transport system permease subunit
MTPALAFPLGVLAARNIVASPLVRCGAKLCLVAVFAVVLLAEVAVTAIRKRVL